MALIPETGPLFWHLLGSATLYVAFHYGAANTTARTRKFIGGAALGLGGVVLMLLGGLDPLRFGLGPSATVMVLPATLALAAVVLPLVAMASRKPDVATTIEQAGPLAWAVYLAGYEFFFRGVLLLALVPELGAATALGVSTALYVFQHLPKHASETASTLVMGVVFGQLALVSGSVWAPFLLHFGIASSAEWAARSAGATRASAHPPAASP